MDPVLAIDGMLIQHLDRDVPESGLVGCCQYDRRCNPGFQCLFPAKRAKTPPVTGPKAWKHRQQKLTIVPYYGKKKAKANSTLKGRWRFCHGWFPVLASKGNVNVGEDRH
jgi:hypothetical protein